MKNFRLYTHVYWRYKTTSYSFYFATWHARCSHHIVISFEYHCNYLHIYSFCELNSLNVMNINVVLTVTVYCHWGSFQYDINVCFHYVNSIKCVNKIDFHWLHALDVWLLCSSRTLTKNVTYQPFYQVGIPYLPWYPAR